MGRRLRQKHLLIVTAKTLQPESDTLSGNEAAELSLAFLEDLIAAARALPSFSLDLRLALSEESAPLTEALWSISHLPLIGNAPGERLVKLMTEGFGLGADALVIVNGAVPHLPGAFIEEAYGRLAAGADAVFGPTESDRNYLIGLRRPLPELLTDADWEGTPLSVTRERAAALNLQAALLPLWYAIETPEDLARLDTDLERGIVTASATKTQRERHKGRSMG